MINDRFIIEPDSILIISKSNKQKQNMTLEGFTTPKSLDLQLESIMKGIEGEVLDAISKTKYFDKKPE